MCRCQPCTDRSACLHGAWSYASRAVDELGHKALIDAARAAGVQRFVYVSGMGAASDHPIDFFRTKYEGERYLERRGLEHVILRRSVFME